MLLSMQQRSQFPFFFRVATPTDIYTLSLHDALPIYADAVRDFFHIRAARLANRAHRVDVGNFQRSEEHTSELQSRRDLVCRLLLEKKKKHPRNTVTILSSQVT